MAKRSSIRTLGNHGIRQRQTRTQSFMLSGCRLPPILTSSFTSKPLAATKQVPLLPAITSRSISSLVVHRKYHDWEGHSSFNATARMTSTCLICGDGINDRKAIKAYQYENDYVRCVEGISNLLTMNPVYDFGSWLGSHSTRGMDGLMHTSFLPPVRFRRGDLVKLLVV